MPKLYNTLKVEKGLKIGLREKSGHEWFADMTFDRSKRTCRKLSIPFSAENSNLDLAKRKARKLYKELNKEFKKIPSEKELNLQGWETKTLTYSLSLLWITGLVWILFQTLSNNNNELFNYLKSNILFVHGLLIAPALVALGGLWVAHMPKGWKPKTKKFSGIALSIFLVSLILSGLLLYYIDSSQAFFFKNYTSLLHSLIGLLLIPLIYWHYTKKSIN